jgi:K+-sensing histidine kinase KdpD
MSAGLHDTSRAFHQRFHRPAGRPASEGGRPGRTRPRAPLVDREAVTVAAGLVGPLVLAGVLAPFRATLPATDAALCLVLVVVAVAAGGKRLGGYLAAVSAAAWFDFFFTRPYNQFDISGRDNIETTVLLLAIGVAITEIAVWGRRQHLTSSNRAGYIEGLRTAAQVVATGTSAATVTDVVRLQLTAVLSLRACLFQPGVAGIGGPARLEQDGRVSMARQAWDADRDGLPPSIATELLAEAGGLLQGRFLMTPLPGARPTLEQRLVAVALADQAGAALASARNQR